MFVLEGGMDVEGAWYILIPLPHIKKSFCTYICILVYIHTYLVRKYHMRQNTWEEIMISSNSIQNCHGFYMARLRKKIKAA